MLGAEVAEMPALAVRPELQGNSLGRLLLALLETAVKEAGVKLLAMPALVPFPSPSPKQGAAPMLQPAPTSEQVTRLCIMLSTDYSAAVSWNKQASV